MKTSDKIEKIINVLSSDASNIEKINALAEIDLTLLAPGQASAIRRIIDDSAFMEGETLRYRRSEDYGN